MVSRQNAFKLFLNRRTSCSNIHILQSLFYRNRMKHVNEQPPKLDCIENIYENTFKSPNGMFNKAMENSEYHELGEFNQHSLYDKLK